MDNNKLMKILLIKIILILGLTTIPFLTFADIEQRRSELLKVLDEELREVARLNKQIGSTRPDLMLRMAQVLLEKARILKDLENQKYLETARDNRDKQNKEDYFKESKRYFDQAQKTVLVLLKKFNKFEDKGDAYYILAFNAKELKQEEQAKTFFQKALEESRPGSVIADKSRIALAEIYFNKGSFDKSLALYEAALKNKRDKWWTKDAFNLAWSYFKMGRHDKAIEKMLESYELSKSSQYIDMTKSIERDLAFFYTEAGKSNEAIAFYKKNGKSVSEVMLKVGRYLKQQGKFAAAEKTLSDALQYKSTEKEEIELNIELISLYEKFGRDQKHLEASRILTSQFSKGNLNVEQIEILKFNVEKMPALIQQQLVQKTYENQSEIRDKKAEDALEYFMMSAQLTPSKGHQAYFLAGETFFAINRFDQAVPLYSEAVKRSQQVKDKKIEAQASNALMVSLGKNVSKKTTDDYLIPAYESYLSLNPKGEKSNIVYQRIFSALIEKKSITDAEKALLKYREHYPSEKETQEKMLAKIMDHYREVGDRAGLLVWVKKIESGEFEVNSEYLQKVKTLMLGMQFEKVEQATVKGDKKGALKGYIQIFNSPETDRDAKKTSAYNIAVLFYETGDWRQVHAWAERAIALMDTNDLLKFEKDFILFTTDLFQRRQFPESASLSEKVFEKTCNGKSKNLKIFFKNANVIYLADKQFEKSMSILNKAPNCNLGSDIILPAYVDHLNELALANKWGALSEVIKKLEQNKEYWPSLIYPFSLLLNELENIGRVEIAQKARNKMISYFEYSKKQKLDIPLEALDAIASYRLGLLDAQVSKFNSIKLQFPESEFNKNLKLKFQLLDKITQEAVSIAEIGSGVGIVKSYKIIVETHEKLRNEMINFLPEGKSSEYVSSFQKSMKATSSPLEKQASDFRQTAIKQIEKENILSSDNSWFLVQNSLFIPEFYSEKGNVIMDKAGSK